MPRSSARTIAAVVALSAAMACSDAPGPTQPTAPARTTGALTSVPASAPWREVLDGETGPGSTYRLYMPEQWNGKLVVYAHGIVNAFLPVTLPTEGDGMARIFGSMGFAVALSSYSETGLAIKDGAQRTHQLNGLFAAQYGKPSHTYLVGSSLGGYVVTSLVEKYPRQYDGVMPVCGVVGGFPAQVDYIFNVRMLFDYLYTDPQTGSSVLPGKIESFPLPADPMAAYGALLAVQRAAGGAIGTDARPLPGALQIALIDQTRMPLPMSVGGPLTPQQFGAFIVTPLVAHAAFVNDVVAHTHGHIAFGNEGTTYTSTGVPFMAPALAAINGGIARVEPDRDAVNWLRHNGETSGELSIPMVSLHNRYDPLVPIVTESIYKAKVAAAGRGDLLVQRTTDGWDHCNFTPGELATGLADLVRWVEEGVKPAP